LQTSPDNAEAQRVRNEATAALQGFDDAISRGQRLLSAGDLDGASAAVRTAREIDPGSAAVAALQEQIVSQYKGLARQRPEAPRSTPSTPAGGTRPDERPAPAAPIDRQQPATVVATPPPEPVQSAQVKPPPSIPEPPPAATPPAAAPSAAATVDATPPAKPSEPAARPAGVPPVESPAAENDDVLITRVIEAWARAIENKDLAAYRALKPNMTAAEQRRIEEGFRAVSSQRVTITILGIEKRGTQAVVRLRRRDAIVVDGRQQTTDAQQTITVARAGSTWVIRDIGR
jgi:hypothetical protein